MRKCIYSARDQIIISSTVGKDEDLKLDVADSRCGII